MNDSSQDEVYRGRDAPLSYSKEEVLDFLEHEGFFDDDFLEHHGVLGMHWGIKRYQPYSTVPRKSGKGGRFIGRVNARAQLRGDKVVARAYKRQARRQARAILNAGKQRHLEKKVAARQEMIKRSRRDQNDNTPKGYKNRSEYDKAKNKALKSGSASDILKFKGDLTNQELKTAKERLNLEKDIATLSEYERDAAARKVQKAFETVDNVRKYTETSINAYNAFAKVSNSLGGTNLPMIKEGSNNNSSPIAEERSLKAIKAYNAKVAVAQKEYYKRGPYGITNTTERKAAYDKAMAEARAELGAEFKAVNEIRKMEQWSSGS